MRSSLLRDWELLQTQLIPALSDANSGHITTWSIGDTNDAVVLVVAFADRVDSALGDLRAFSSETATKPTTRWGDVGLSFGDVDRVLPTSRSAWFRRHQNRWLPKMGVADHIVLTPPSTPVDLVTVRGTTQLEPGVGESLRDGGFLFFVDGPPPPLALCTLRAPGGGDEGGSAWIRPLRTERRLFQKVGGPRASRRAWPGALAGGAVGPTLAARLAQEELVLAHVDLARSLARRFAHRGQPLDDLEQVALLALLGAARRYDASRGSAFVSYASASIVGELKRYFRDRSWSMRVPRSLQELHLVVGGAREELNHQLGHAPTTEQIAGHLGAREEDVVRAMEAGSNYRVESLDVAPMDDERAREIPMIDESFDLVLDRQRLRAVLPRLDHRELTILKGLYFDGRTQQDLAEELGVSQMHVSRLAARAVVKLRA
jgi:RNA polymerase sigma-B factor